MTLAIDLYRDLDVLAITGEYERNLTLMQEAEALARALNDQSRLGQVLARKSFLLRMLADYEGAIEVGQQGLALAVTLGDSAMHVAVAHRLAQAYFAWATSARLPCCCGRMSRRWRQVCPIPACCTALCPGRGWRWCWACEGISPRAAPMGRKRSALRQWRAAAIMPIAHGCLGLPYLTQGDLEQAMRVLTKGLAICRASDNRDWSRQIAAGLGQAYALMGHLTEGFALLEEALRNDVRTGALHAHSEHMARLSEVCLLAGRRDEARQHAHRALDLARQHRERGYEARALCQLGAVYASDDPSHVEPAATHYRQALALAAACGMRPLQAHCHRGLGILYAKTEPARTGPLGAGQSYRTLSCHGHDVLAAEAEAALAQVTEG